MIPREDAIKAILISFMLGGFFGTLVTILLIK